MKRTCLFMILFCWLSVFSVFSQETFKVMFYNLLDFPQQGPADRIDKLEIILQDYQPDLFMVCELNSAQGAADILGLLQNITPSYSAATFVNNTSDDSIGDSNELQNMLFYDSAKFSLIDEDIVTTIFRDFNHYTLRLNTVDQMTNPIILNAIVCHLKSSSGTDNQALRLQMVDDLVAYLETFSPDSLVMLAGDLNLYTQSEPAFQELIDPTNNITFTDPPDRVGSWNNNLVYLDVFTQSTRTQSGLGGATGGFDDRFDFILTSENMMSDPDLFYVNDSYLAFGNNNNSDCYNQAINSSDCDGPLFSQSIRNALHDMSDHLPVTLEISTPSELLNTEEFTIFGEIRFIDGNVVTDRLILELPDSFMSNTELMVYDPLGRRVSHFRSQDQNRFEWDVSTWSSGIYYIVHPEFRSGPLKFIKK